MEKEETKPNEFYAPRYGSPVEDTHGRHRTHDFIAPIKVQVPLDETILPKIREIPDFSQSDIATSGEEEEELAIKGQRPATVWSNVDKVSPIDLPNEHETNRNTVSEAEEGKPRNMKINLLGIPQDTDFLKSSDERNVVAAETDEDELPLKIQRPAEILSNVDKLLPIVLPNESETKDTKDSTQHADEVAMN